MSWQLTPRLTTVSQAVSIALLSSAGLIGLSQFSHAANIGRTDVKSAQHEPLSATIIVTDIDVNTFSASLADNSLYQQLGLQPTDSMSVRFEPTSDTAGRVVISTSKPVSAPFADVVLSINDSGRQQIIPKTLLMPVNNNKPKNVIAAGSSKPNLPVVSTQNTKPQPPIVSTTPTNDTNSQTELNTANNTYTSATAAVNQPTTSAQQLPTPYSNESSNVTANNQVLSNTDKQSDILNIQITRTIRPLNSQGQPTASYTVVNNVPTEADIAQPTTAPITANNNIADTSSTQTSEPTADVPAGTATYTVQRNDNLWSIANELADKNNLDVHDVMQQILDQNPDAFINRDASLLKTNAQLTLPAYDVIPSQQSLQSAIQAQRQASSSSSSSRPSRTRAAQARRGGSQASQGHSKSAPVNARRRPSRQQPSNTTVTKTLPKARMSVLAPGSSGQADGMQTKASAATGKGISTDILASLKSSRQRTASQAERVLEVNDQLASYTQKIQIQNQRLAELQENLKKLRQQ